MSDEVQRQLAEAAGKLADAVEALLQLENADNLDRLVQSVFEAIAAHDREQSERASFDPLQDEPREIT